MCNILDIWSAATYNSYYVLFPYALSYSYLTSGDIELISQMYKIMRLTHPRIHKKTIQPWNLEKKGMLLVNTNDIQSIG